MGPRNYLKKSALLRHPRIYAVLELILFSAARTFARIRTKNLLLAILLTDTQPELKITQNFTVSRSTVYSYAFLLRI